MEIGGGYRAKREREREENDASIIARRDGLAHVLRVYCGFLCARVVLVIYEQDFSSASSVEMVGMVRRGTNNLDHQNVRRQGSQELDSVSTCSLRTMIPNISYDCTN